MSDGTFADIRAAFAELRQVLGLPADGEFQLESGPADGDGPDTYSVRWLNEALTEARACEAWYRDAPEWQRITKVSEAARALFTAIREAAGDYWAEVRQDLRVRGFTRAVAARVARTISLAADGLARKLEHAGHGCTHASKAMQNLHRAASACAGQIIGYPQPGSQDRMSQVADIIAELGRAPLSSETASCPRASARTVSQVTSAHACFPGSWKQALSIHKVAATAHKVAATARRNPVQGTRTRERRPVRNRR